MPTSIKSNTKIGRDQNFCFHDLSWERCQYLLSGISGKEDILKDNIIDINEFINGQ